MNLFKKIFSKRNTKAVNQPSYISKTYYNRGNAYLDAESTSFAAVDKIANSFASLSFGVYSYASREKVQNHFLYNLLKEPNADETHFTFFNSIVHDYYDGNVYLLKIKDDSGNIISLFRLEPAKVYVDRDSITNRKTFSYNGTKYTSDDVLHIPSRWNYNGLKGDSIFHACRKVFETANEMDSYTRNTFSNTLGKRLVIDISKAYPTATDEQRQQLQNKYISDYAGVDNAGKPVIRAPGVEFDTIDSGITDNRAAQLEEQRTYQKEVISELFQIPIDFLSGKTTQSIESLYTIYVSNAIEPLALAFSDAFQKLMNPLEREQYYFEFNYDSLIRTDINTRISVLIKQITNALLSPNDARKMENKPPLPEAGDNYFIASNLMPLNNETITAYMAKQKATVQETNEPKYSEHSPTGDDKI